MVENYDLRVDLFLMDLFQLGDLSGIHDKADFLPAQNPFQDCCNGNLVIDKILLSEMVTNKYTEIYQA